MFNHLQTPLSFIKGSAGQIKTVSDVAVMLANVFIVIAFGLSVATMAIAFIQFGTSTGDVKAVEKAQRSLLWSGIGLFVSLAAFAIKSALLKAMGVEGLD